MMEVENKKLKEEMDKELTYGKFTAFPLYYINEDNPYLGKLKVGQRVKSYKLMCKILGEDEFGGNSKIAQLKKWEHYFRYRQSGQQFFITEVFDHPAIVDDATLDKRSRKSEIQELMRSGLLSVLDCYADGDKYNIQMTYKQLFRLFGMVNELYMSSNFQAIKAASGLVGKSDKYVKKLSADVYRAVHSDFKRTITRVFESLQKQRILMFMPGYKIIATKTGELGERTNVTRIATKKEISYILGVEKRVLTEFGYGDVTELYFSNRFVEYYERIGEIIKTEMGWEKTFQVIDIVFNPENVKKEVNIIPLKYRMNEIFVTRAKKILCNKVSNQLTNQASSKWEDAEKYKKDGEDLDAFDYYDDYLVDIDKVIDALIKI